MCLQLYPCNDILAIKKPTFDHIFLYDYSAHQKIGILFSLNIEKKTFKFPSLQYECEK